MTDSGRDTSDKWHWCRRLTALEMATNSYCLPLSLGTVNTVYCATSSCQRHISTSVHQSAAAAAAALISQLIRASVVLINYTSSVIWHCWSGDTKIQMLMLLDCHCQVPSFLQHLKKILGKSLKLPKPTSILGKTWESANCWNTSGKFPENLCKKLKKNLWSAKGKP